ncbi:MAG: hypothetical protein JNK45_06990 [Myxococcales bacterium]|nr:hypothetical protein [Myxococcales bacterium]
MSHRVHVLFASIIVACGSGSSPTGQGSTSDTSGAAPGSEGDVSSSTGDDIELTHGTVTLSLVRSEMQASDPFVATTRVIATLTYRDCLTAFYAAHPELAQGGDEGQTIFGSSLFGGEAWTDRLCDGGEATQASCTVESILQELGATPPQLTVTYAITGDLEGRTLRFGPLPTTTTAGCPDAIVHVAAKSALSGEDADGRPIWATDNLSDIDAITNQAAAVVIRGARLE